MSARKIGRRSSLYLLFGFEGGPKVSGRSFGGFVALMAGCPKALEVEVLSSTPPVALII